MLFILYIIILYFGSVLLSKAVAPISMRPQATRYSIVAFPIFTLALYFANDEFDHVPSETDTKLYDTLSQVKITTLEEVKDVFSGRLTVETMAEGEYITSEWGGWYLRLLILINQLVDGSLFGKKAFNVMWFPPLISATVALIYALDGMRLARGAWLPLTLIPTLWYPFLVLYRDILTTFCHTIVLLGCIRIMLRAEAKSINLMLCVAGIGFGFLLRPGTFVINLLIIGVVLIGAALFLKGSSTGLKGAKKSIATVILGALLAFVALGGDLGILLGSIEKSVRTETSGLLPRIVQGVMMLHLFVASEPVLFSRDLQIGNIEQLRGALNGVWFAFWAPFVICGTAIAARTLLKSGVGTYTGRNVTAHFPPGIKFVLWCLLGYVTCWWAITTELADFTRWRLPAVPVLAVLAVYAWSRLEKSVRIVILVGWWLTIVIWRIGM